jgi:hypothetical protein
MERSMLQQTNKQMNKKALSEMVSYVLLISIVVVAAIAVIGWIMTYVNVEPVADCEPGTSLILDSYTCSNSSEIAIELRLKNNGRFNIAGVTVAVGNSTNSTPDTYLIAKEDVPGILPGRVWFEDGKIKPGGYETIELRNITGDPSNPSDRVPLNFDVKVIQIQPFILAKSGMIVCQGTVINEEPKNCWTKP